MLRRLLQPLWVLLAIVFLIEAWLWDHLEPVVARVVSAIPLRAGGSGEKNPTLTVSAGVRRALCRRGT